MVRLANLSNALRSKLPATLRALRRLLLTIVVITALLVVAAVGYTWYMGRSQPAALVQDEATSEPVLHRAIITPSTPAENSPVGVYVQQTKMTASAGQLVTLDARTRAFAECTVEVKYSETKKDSFGLPMKTADEYGTVSWKWILDDTTPVGTWPVTVACAYGEQSGVMTVKLTVE